MRNYELMYVVKPDLEEDKTAEIMEKFNNIITANGGEVVSAEKWGKRRLAYEINDYREGLYILVNFKGEAATAREIDRIMKITDEILRFMIVVKEAK